MQNSEKKTMKPEFQASAAVPEQQKLSFAAERLNPQRKARFEEMKNRQDLAMKAEQERFARQREDTVKAVKQQLLDHRAKNLSPYLTPRHFPKPSRQQMSEVAENDARAQVAQMEDRCLLEMEQKFQKDQERFIERAQSAERRMEFNRASAQGCAEPIQAQDKGGQER